MESAPGMRGEIPGSHFVRPAMTASNGSVHYDLDQLRAGPAECQRQF